MATCCDVSILMRRVGDVIRGADFRYARETQLHRGIEQCLAAAGLDPLPEVKIHGGRIDFVVERLGIEVKVKGTAADVLEQLVRYSSEPSLHGLMLISTRPAHLQVPAELAGKPVETVLIGSRL